MSQSWTVGRYLVERVREAGVDHIFGVPGDYVLVFMDDIVASPIELVGTCNELNAGYAADAYARLNGVGAICVTYAVGGFSALNAVAGAFAERLPIIVLCGSPNRQDANEHKLLHHTVGDYGVQVDVYRNVTERALTLTDAEDAPKQIDTAIQACIQAQRPVFIEIPNDLVHEACAAPQPLELKRRAESDANALSEAVDEAMALLAGAKRPVVLAGIEIERFGLMKELEEFLDHTGYPVAATLHAKSVISETHPQYAGLYYGAMSDGSVRKLVEEDAGCVLALGAWMTDINLGVYTAQIDAGKLINAGADRVTIGHHSYHKIYLGDFLSALQKKLADMPAASDHRPPVTPAARSLDAEFTAVADAPMTVARFYQRMNHFLDTDNIVLADAGDSLFSAASLIMHEKAGFIAQSFYCSIGFTVPAALGAGLADPGRRPVVFVGDGAFQMTAQEVSTLIRRGVAPIIFVMNNQGYTVERMIHDGPYNDIQNWVYHMLSECFGGPAGWEVRTEGDLERVLEHAAGNRDEMVFVEVHLDPLDCSKALKDLGAAIGKARELHDT
ncbi:MAG: thiamine pyrophosphate-binding protein [Pseudomonadota bacterium]